MSSAEQSKIRMEASKLAQEAENRAVAEPRRALEELFANSAYPDIFKEKLRSFDRYTLIREGTMKEIIYEQFEKEIKSSHTKDL